MSFSEAASKAGLTPSKGKKAIKKEYRDKIKMGKYTKIIGSIDLDTHFKNKEPNRNRWDYGCGFKRNKKEFVIWVEFHPARENEDIECMIKKLNWLKDKLNGDKFRDLKRLTNKSENPYRWICSGKIYFRKGGKEEKKLAKFGLKLPERSITI